MHKLPDWVEVTIKSCTCLSVVKMYITRAVSLCVCVYVSANMDEKGRAHFIGEKFLCIILGKITNKYCQFNVTLK